MWFHGSPLKLNNLKAGSTITRWKDLAVAFSHKPTCLIIDDKRIIKHNGKLKGFLYVIDEEPNENDIIKHPNSSMDDGMEWITKRDSHVLLIEEIPEINEPNLSDEEITELLKRNE